ncbi:MAG: hypothetical protein WEB03_14235 [Nitriliruptor sp.]|uniref:hypothetical protein n=1 Tax=Nitriliruptor sp. TaxID=2448056 RepID=UPI0034A00A8B
MKRLLAVLVAVGLVGLGFLVRDLRAGGDGALPTLPGGGSSAAASVLCDEAFAEVCDALAADGELDVRREPAGTTVDRLVALPDGASGEDLPEAWVTIAPWPAIVDEDRIRRGLAPLFDPAAEDTAIASSPLVLVTWDDRGEVLAAACEGGVIGLACLGEAAGRSWSDLGGPDAWAAFKPGLEDPARSSLGLAALGAFTAAELDTLGFGTRSLADGGYLDVIARFGRSVPDFRPSAGSPLAAAVLTGPSSFDLVLTSEAAARRAIEGSAQWGPRLVAAYPPVVGTDGGATSFDLVVATTGGTDAESLRGEVGAAAGAAGWHTSEVTPPPLAGEPGDTSQLPTEAPGATLPGAGALTALRTTFTETVR